MKSLSNNTKFILVYETVKGQTEELEPQFLREAVLHAAGGLNLGKKNLD